MNFSEKLYHAAAPYEAVAFDVFDTLLRRDVGRPDDLFDLLGAEFAAARRQAEREARAARRGEVTLEEIYARPALAGYDPQTECAAELAAVVPNRVLLRAARFCRDRGQKLYAVSDMYLPAAQIEAMLRKCGFDFLDGIFVSSAYGVQKRSGGLFRVFLRETGLAPRQVLFVGDDRRADVLGAALAGIRCLPVPAVPPLPYTPPQQELVPRACYAFAQNRDAGLGFETIGPLAVGFAQWLHARRGDAPKGRMLFLARDMELILRIYRRLYPEDTDVGYLRVSRRSLCPLLLARGQTALAAEALPRQRLTAAQIVRWCGAEPSAIDAERCFDLRTPEGKEEALPFLRTLTVRPEKAQAVQAYLEQTALAEGTLLVDIGSGGTTQKLLENLCGVSLRGLYLACDERLDHTRAAVYLFDGKPAPLWYWAAQPLLERLISEPCGPTVGYLGSGRYVRPVIAPQAAEPLAEEFRQGALRYAVQWRRSVLHGQVIPADFAVQPFLRLTRAPRLEDARRLGALTLEDGGSYMAAQPQPWRRYLLRPAAYPRDLRESRWKVGFLKQTFRLPLPYDRVYAALKQRKGE